MGERMSGTTHTTCNQRISAWRAINKACLNSAYTCNDDITNYAVAHLHLPVLFAYGLSSHSVPLFYQLMRLVINPSCNYVGGLNA